MSRSRRSLNPDGVLALCVPGGENIMGTELVTIGASTKLTLTQVFPNLVLAPGDTTWFIASDTNDLTGDPGTLRDRFAGVPKAAEVYPPNGLLSIYLPDRAAKAIDAYNSADLPAEHLLNRDSRPLANLYGSAAGGQTIRCARHPSVQASAPGRLSGLFGADYHLRAFAN